MDTWTHNMLFKTSYHVQILFGLLHSLQEHIMQASYTAYPFYWKDDMTDTDNIAT